MKTVFLVKQTFLICVATILCLVTAPTLAYAQTSEMHHQFHPSMPLEELLDSQEKAGLVTEQRAESDELLTAALYKINVDNQAAIEFLKQAANADPSYEKPPRYLCDVYRDLGNYNAAVEACQEAVNRLPNFGSFHNALGEVSVLAGKKAEAIAAFNRAKELEPENHVACYYLGTIYTDQNNLPQALANFNCSVKWGEGFYAEAYAGRGNVHALLGNRDRAQADFFEAARIYELHGDMESAAEAMNRANQL